LSKSKQEERYQAVLAYDGARYHGSQRQTPEVLTVQGEVEKALRELAWNGETVLFAGRTDAGVHAQGQVIAFDLAWSHTREELQRALNSLLPRDIAVRGIKQVPGDFHPRYDAQARKYEYCLYCQEVRDPLQDRYAWQVWPPISLARVQEASRGLIGIHDFGAFGRAHKPGGSTVREIYSAAWHTEGDRFSFQVVGNAFLYHMVRHMVQLLAAIGRKWEEISAVKRHLAAPEGPPVQGLAPAKGLTLREVMYEN
jgi:tRNA pseudouridine38-40 synthase